MKTLLRFFLFFNAAALHAIDAEIGEVRIVAPYNQGGKVGVRVELRNAVIKGMAGKSVTYSAQASQAGAAIDEVVSTRPNQISADPAYEALPAHFFYTFDELKEKGDPSKPYTFTVWIVNSENEEDYQGSTANYSFPDAPQTAQESSEERLERLEKELSDPEDPLKAQTMEYLESMTGENVASIAEPAVDAAMKTMQERILTDLAQGKLPDAESWDSFKEELVDGYKSKIVEMAMGPLSQAARGRYMGLCEAKAAQALGLPAGGDQVGKLCLKVWGKIEEAVQDKVKEVVFEKLIPKLKEKLTAFFQKKSEEAAAQKQEKQEEPESSGGALQLTRLLSKPGSLGGFFLFWNPVTLGKDDYLDVYAAESPSGPFQKCSWLAYPDPASGGSESHSKVNRCPFSMQYDTTYYFRVRIMGPGRTEADVSNVVSGLQRRN